MTKLELDKLNHMGKTWFVLRFYQDHIDSSERRCELCDSNSFKFRREPRYKETKKVHAEFLLEILATKNRERLSSNKLGVTSDEVITMAKQCVLSLIK